MRKIITAVTVLAAVGVITAFAASRVPSHEAGAAPPCGNPKPPTPCTPTPTVTAGASSTPTTAATPTPSPPPVLQTREDQITIWTGGMSGWGCCFESVDPNWRALQWPSISLDTNEYPDSSVFHFEVTFPFLNASGCARLFEITGVTGTTITGTPVAGSEICVSSGVNFPSRARSLGAIGLQSGSHEYIVQFGTGGGALIPNAARIIADWLEVSP